MKTKQIRARKLTEGRRVVEIPDVQVNHSDDDWPVVTSRTDGRDELDYPVIYIELSSTPGRRHELDPRDVVTVLVKD